MGLSGTDWARWVEINGHWEITSPRSPSMLVFAMKTGPPSLATTLASEQPFGLKTFLSSMA